MNVKYSYRENCCHFAVCFALQGLYTCKRCKKEATVQQLYYKYLSVSWNMKLYQQSVSKVIKGLFLYKHIKKQDLRWHGERLQYSLSQVSHGHGSPPGSPGVNSRVLSFIPPPHDLVHTPQSVHSWRMQSQGTMLQTTSSSAHVLL